MLFVYRIAALLLVFTLAACGGGGGSSGGGTTPDTTPNVFSFVDEMDVDLLSEIDSNTITVSGIDAASPISIVDGEYAISGGGFTSSSGTVSNGQQVVVRQTSSDLFSTQTDTVLSIGGVNDTFSVTTLAEDNTPESFSFTDESSAARNTVFVSNVITITGINSSAAISVTGGEYAIDGGAFTDVAGTVVEGQNVQIRQTSSTNFATTTDVVLTVGGVMDTFSVTTLVEDLVPGVFTFIDQNNVPVNTVATSNTLTVSGVNNATAISVVGGEYSIDGDAFTSADGLVNNGQQVVVRQTSSASFSSTVSATLTIGGVSDSFEVTTQLAPPDTTPDAFAFFDQADVPISDLIASNTITVSGINSAASISVVGGSYSVNGSPFTTISGTVNNGNVVQLQQTSSALFATTTDVALTIGGLVDTFSVTTIAEDIIPDGFVFADRTDVSLSTVVESNTITVAGVNNATAISVVGGEYSINGGSFTSSSGTIADGQQVVVRQTSSNNFLATTDAVLTIGGVSDTFSITTRAGDSTPDAFAFADEIDVPLDSPRVSNTITVSGIEVAAAISVAGGEYAIDGNVFTTSSGTINNGQIVSVRQTSSPTVSTTTDTSLTIGGVSATFSVTTQSVDTAPDPFSFIDQIDVDRNIEVTSNLVTITGIDDATPISISGGEYSIEGGAFVSTPGTIDNGEELVLRLTSSIKFNKTADAVLTVGSVSDTFSVTTLSTHAVVIDKELMITDLTVVESVHTLPGGKWTFEHLITEMMPQAAPTDQEKSDFVLNLLEHWTSTQTVNGLSVPARTSMQTQVINPWLAASGGVDLDLSIAPFRLLAIVNRLDLAKRDNLGNVISAGEGRFVFGVVNSSGFSLQFTVIFEYGLPASDEQELDQWVEQWHALGALDHSNIDPAYNDALVAVTDRFTAKNADLTKPNGSALNQFRTNEIALAGPWELREFQLSGVSGNLEQVTVKENPDFNTINNTTRLSDFVNGNEAELLAGTIGLPDSFQGQSFLGGSAINNGGFGAIFRATGINSNEARHKLSVNTCSGCHGGETNTSFLHVFPRNIGQESNLSGFLRGQGNGQPITVFDPVDSTPREFFDLDLRRQNLECLLNDCNVDDLTPDPFSFIDQNDVLRASQVSSNAITVMGINSPTPISVAGGDFSIDGGPFLSAPTTIVDGQQVVVRQTSSSNFSASTDVTITVGGIGDTFTVTTVAGDSTPDAFSFTDQTGVSLNTLITSGSIIVAGIDDVASISVTNGSYSIDGGPFVAVASTVANGQSVRVRVTSSSNALTSTQTILTIGGVSDAFSVTTGVGDTTPNSFSFADQSNVELNALITSASVSISGFNGSSPISVVNGEYSVDSGSFTSANGIVTNAQSIRVRVQSSSSFSTTTQATLTVGGVSDSFEVTTAAIDTTPDSFTLIDQNASPGVQVTSAPTLISGVNSPTPISISGGEYAINSDPFTSAVGNVNSGDSVVIRVTSAGVVGSTVSALLTIGGVADSFDVTTQADLALPTASIVFPSDTSLSDGQAVTIRGVAADDSSGVAAVSVNGVAATSVDGFANWIATVPLTIGNNVLNVSVSDTATNTNSTADQIQIFNDQSNFLSEPREVAIDTANNRAWLIDKGRAAIIEINLTTGIRTVVLDSDALITDPKVSIFNPRSIVYDNVAEKLYVIDAETRSIWQFDLLSQSYTILSGRIGGPFDTGTHVPDFINVLSNPLSMALDRPNNRLLAVEQLGTNSRITAIDITTGARQFISNNTTPNNLEPLARPTSIVVDSINNRALVTDESDLIAVDLTTGARTLIATLGPFNISPVGIALDAANDRVFVVSSPLGTAPEKRILSVDLQTSAVTTFSGNTIPNSNIPLLTPMGLALDSVNNRLLVADRARQAVVEVSLIDGARTLMSDGLTSTPDGLNPLFEPRDIVVDTANNRLIVADPFIAHDGIATATRSTHLVEVDMSNGTRSLLFPNRGIQFASYRALDLDPANDRVILLAGFAVSEMNLLTEVDNVLSDNSDPGPPLNLNTFGIAYDAANNKAYVLLRSSILSVDLGTGVRTTLSSTTVPSSLNTWSNGTSLIFDDTQNRLLLIDASEVTPKIIAVDIITGARTILSSNTVPNAINNFSSIADAALDSINNRLLVVDRHRDAVLEVSLSDGSRSFISGFGLSNGQNMLARPEAIDIDVSNNLAYIVDQGLQSIMLLDLITGERVFMSR